MTDLRAALRCWVLLLAAEGVSQESKHAPLSPLFEAPVDTTVCVLARNHQSIDVHTALRIRGRIYRLLDELVIRNSGCRFVVEVASSTVPAGPDGRDMAAASPGAINSGGSTSSRENLQALLRYVDARVAPVKKGAACLVCGRYRVRATVVGHLSGSSGSRADGGATAAAKRGAWHLVIQSVSNISTEDLYGTLYPRDKYIPVPQN